MQIHIIIRVMSTDLLWVIWKDLLCFVRAFINVSLYVCIDKFLHALCRQQIVVTVKHYICGQ